MKKMVTVSRISSAVVFPQIRILIQVVIFLLMFCDVFHIICQSHIQLKISNTNRLSIYDLMAKNNYDHETLLSCNIYGDQCRWKLPCVSAFSDGFLADCFDYDRHAAYVHVHTCTCNATG